MLTLSSINMDNGIYLEETAQFNISIQEFPRDDEQQEGDDFCHEAAFPEQVSKSNSGENFKKIRRLYFFTLVSNRIIVSEKEKNLKEKKKKKKTNQIMVATES